MVGDGVPLPSASYKIAVARLERAAVTLFQRDPRARTLGVRSRGDGHAFVSTRSLSIPVPLGLDADLPVELEGIPVSFRNTHGVPKPMVEPECGSHRPLCLGLELENADLNARLGYTQRPLLGTLGGVVRFPDGGMGLLSNNHVLAGNNRGQAGDRVAQPAGSLDPAAPDPVAVLESWVDLRPSPYDAATTGQVIYNEVDLAVARAATVCSNEFLVARNRLAPRSVGTPAEGNKVFKIGRTTGYTEGEIAAYPVIVREVPYSALGECWFRNAFEIQASAGKFSDHGDSGSLIFDDAGQAVGVLFAGMDDLAYAFPLQTALDAVGCDWWV